MRRFMQLADDSDAQVRANALWGLGRFLLLGEYGEIDDDLAREAQEIALRMHSDGSQPTNVRRRALEALGNSSHPRVEGLIRRAYSSDNRELRVGAIHAMGRTCNPVWGECLLEELDSGDSEIVYLAITACGQVQLQAAVKRLGEFAESEDEELQYAAIEALGEIGGQRVMSTLDALEDLFEEDMEPELRHRRSAGSRVPQYYAQGARVESWLALRQHCASDSEHGLHLHGQAHVALDFEFASHKGLHGVQRATSDSVPVVAAARTVISAASTAPSPDSAAPSAILIQNSPPLSPLKSKAMVAATPTALSGAKCSTMPGNIAWISCASAMLPS